MGIYVYVHLSLNNINESNESISVYMYIYIYILVFARFFIKKIGMKPILIDFKKKLKVRCNSAKKSAYFIGSNQFFEKIDQKVTVSIYVIIFELRDRFWTLWDGPLDPLDRYKNQKKIDFSIKIHIF